MSLADFPQYNIFNRVATDRYGTKPLYGELFSQPSSAPTASTVTAVPPTNTTRVISAPSLADPNYPTGSSVPTSLSDPNYTPSTLPGVRTNIGSSATGWTPVIMDPLAAAQQAIAGAKNAWPEIAGLAGTINDYNQNTVLKHITDLYPQFTSTTSQLGANIADWAQGNISQSSRNQMAQRLAERGINSGIDVNSPNSNAALMAVLGKTTEGLQGQALAGYNALIGALPKTTPVDPTKWMVGAGDIFNAQNWANILASAPNSLDAYNLAMANANRGLSAGYGAGASGASGGGGSGSNTSWLDNLIGKYSTTPTTSSGGTGTTGNVSGGGGTSVSDYGYGEGQFNPDYFQLDASGSILPWYGGITNPTGQNFTGLGGGLAGGTGVYTGDYGYGEGQFNPDFFDLTSSGDIVPWDQSDPFDNWTDEDWGNYYGDIYPELYY